MLRLTPDKKTSATHSVELSASSSDGVSERRFSEYARSDVKGKQVNLSRFVCPKSTSFQEVLQTFGDKDEGGASEEEAFVTCRKETFSRGVPSTLSNSSREKTPEQPAI